MNKDDKVNVRNPTKEEVGLRHPTSDEVRPTDRMILAEKWKWYTPELRDLPADLVWELYSDKIVEKVWMMDDTRIWDFEI